MEENKSAADGKCVGQPDIGQGEITGAMASAILEAIMPAIKAIIDAFINGFGAPGMVHIAYRSKKWRSRKKAKRRIINEATKMINKAAKQGGNEYVE